MSNKDGLYIEPVAYIRNGYKEKFGVPRQSGLVPSVKSRIEFCEEYRDENCIREIEQYTHLWLIWGFSKNEKKWSPTVRPPKLGGNKRVGVFASRSPFRPNAMGLSCVKLEGVEAGKNGKILLVSGGDLADGTPIYDIKPYLPYVDSIPYAQGGFSEEHKNEFLQVDLPHNLRSMLSEGEAENLTELLSLNPCPAYKGDGERMYGLTFEDMQVKFRYENSMIKVVDIKRG